MIHDLPLDILNNIYTQLDGFGMAQTAFQLTCKTFYSASKSNPQHSDERKRITYTELSDHNRCVWLFSNGNVPKHPEACELVALNPNMKKTLGWLNQNDYPWNSRTPESLAVHGDHETLEWVLSKGCLMDSWTGVAAAYNGHIKTLEVAHKRGCIIGSRAAKAAAENKQNKALRWIHRHNKRIGVKKNDLNQIHAIGRRL